METINNKILEKLSRANKNELLEYLTNGIIIGNSLYDSGEVAYIIRKTINNSLQAVELLKYY